MIHGVPDGSRRRHRGHPSRQAEGSVVYCQEQGLTPDRLNNATQIVWATGGRLVPEEIWDVYLNTHLDA